MICPSTAAHAGLSPRLRGNLGEDALKELPHRSIPASAGEPISLYTSGCFWKVYPRVCGGTWNPLVSPA